MSGGGGKTEVNNEKFPDWMAPYVMNSAGRAKALFRKKNQKPPPRMFVGMDPTRGQGLAIREDLARSGSPVAGAGVDEYVRTMRGDYLSPDSNPYLEDIANRSVQGAMGSISGAYGGSGRIGSLQRPSGAWANAMTDAGTQIYSQIFGDHYGAERDRMMQMGSMAPDIYDLSQADARTLEDVGMAREEKAAESLQADYQEWNWPYEALDRYTATIYGNPAARPMSSNSTSRSAFNWGNAIQSLLGG